MEIAKVRVAHTPHARAGWDGTKIVERGEWLFEISLKVWPGLARA